ncbi:single-stranded-DNA-specific exonuclease RecJ [Bacillaceae bacterium S4-13-58]
MLHSKSKWIIQENIDQINHSLSSYSPLLRNLLINRGITTEEEAKIFLNPSLSDLSDPFLFSGMDRAVERVKEAIELGEHILVFGDYDADGVSATSVLMEALLECEAIAEYYIPNRFKEGYGPNEVAFQNAAAEGFSLIITVDTGIAAVHEAKIAKELGIDLIITDHHEAQEELPDAYAIIHPKLSPNYPFKELAGVGVAFQFARALLGYFPKHLLDLVAIGTIADLVPLREENRVLATFGLKAFSQTNRPGLIHLKKQSGIKEDVINEEHIGFVIAPRINAVGRLQDAYPAVELLMSQNDEEAKHLAEEIDQLNKVRQQLVTEIAEEAEAMLEDNPDQSVLVVAKEGWNQGVLGIVASRLVQKFERPAIVLAIDSSKNEAKGSARSIGAFDLFSNCMKVKSLFTHFGGHAQAAGMTLPIENVSSLRDILNELANKELSPEDFVPILEVDTSCDWSSLSVDAIQEMNQLAPFGMGNPKPLFHFDKAVPQQIRQIGANLDHLKLLFEKENKKIDMIGFGMGSLYQKIAIQSELEAVGRLQINEWNGRKSVQLMLEDLRIQHWQLFDHRGTKQLENILSQLNAGDTKIFTFKNHVNGQYFSQSRVLYEDWKQDKTIINDSHLVFVDLPYSLQEMEEVLQQIQSDCVFVCFQREESRYLTAFPSREDFKWLYAFFRKQQTISLQKDREKIAQYKGWNPEIVDFMSMVFFDLDFVTIENGYVTIQSKPGKKDLSDSSTYQKRLQQIEVEKTLYYSSYQELKNWMEKAMNSRTMGKEEVLNGL